MKTRGFIALALAGLALLAPPLVAGATPPAVAQATATFDYTKNMKPLGYSAGTIPDAGPGSGVFNADLAFWGENRRPGTYSGFRLVDISAPANPTEIIDREEGSSPTSTAGNQGDVIIWENLIIRSWNSPAPGAGARCGNWQVNPGEEGVHVIDISQGGEGPGDRGLHDRPGPRRLEGQPEVPLLQGTGGISLGHSATLTWDGK